MADKNFSSKGSFRKLQNELKKSFEETIKKASTEAFDDVEIEGESAEVTDVSEVEKSME